MRKAQALVCLAAFLLSTNAQASEIKVLSAASLKAVLEELIPEFEKSSGHRIAVSYGTSVALKQKIDGGEPFDVAFLAPRTVEELIAGQKLLPDARAVIGRTGIGVAVKAGTAHPDISTPEAFKRAVLNARSIATSDPALGGTAAVHFSKLVQRFGIEEQVKPKMKLTKGGEAALPVARGEADFAVALVSEIVPVPGVEHAHVPAELQTYIVVVGDVSTHAADRIAADQFIKFMGTGTATKVLERKGMERG